MRYDLPEDRWVKSTYSTAGGNDCVETQMTNDGHVAVRDSKAPELGAYGFARESWTVFLECLKSRRL
ncbi:DUF397 domain-containing protein [Streptomyces sp. B6B3]|uniref:DUF397 domain-containing protein n=1 Tax=Streptomyces sp. B6B3 TaxID=3153570 RepID=UPI00325CE359